MSYVEKLPAKYVQGEHKGEQAFVKITNEKLNHPKTNPILIEQDRFGFPQYGPKPVYDEKGNQTNIVTEEEAKAAFEEMAVDAGGWVHLLDYNNGSIQTDAVDSGKLYIRTAESAPKNEDGTLNVNAVIESGLKRSMEFTLKATEKVTAKEIKSTVDSLLSNLANLTNDQIAEAIKALAK